MAFYVLCWFSWLISYGDCKNHKPTRAFCVWCLCINKYTCLFSDATEACDVRSLWVIFTGSYHVFYGCFGNTGCTQSTIYTRAMSSQEIDETKHAEINPDFNHLHHRTASVVDYRHSFAENVKPTDMEKELNIIKHGKTEDLGNRVNSTNRVRVIINAKYRTGSSFTGELFIKHSLFAYYFEPLHYFADITTTESRSEDVILWTLERLLNCTITDTDLEAGRLGTEFWKPIVLCGFKTGKHWKRNMHPAWKSNYIGNKVWYETTYSFLNFNGCTVEVWEWISNFIPHFMMRVINIRAEM